MQTREQSCGGWIVSAYGDGLGYGGQQVAVDLALFLGELEIVREGFLGLAVVVGVGLDAGDELGDVGGIDYVVGDELGQVVFLVGYVDVEVEVLRIDAADAEVGDVAHDVDGHGDVEERDGVGGLVVEGVDALGPARGVVVVGDEAFVGGVLELLHEGCGGCGGRRRRGSRRLRSCGRRRRSG